VVDADQGAFEVDFSRNNPAQLALYDFINA
jgi:hypothetical protein